MKKEVRDEIRVAMGSTAVAGGLIGITGSDLPIVAGAWGRMMYKIAKAHDVKLDLKTCVNTSAAILASLASYKLSCTLLIIGLGAVVTVVSGGLLLPVAIGMSALANALVTYRLGKLFDEMYGSKNCKKAIKSLGRQALTSLFIVPSPNEFKEFWNDYNG